MHWRPAAASHARTQEKRSAIAELLILKQCRAGEPDWKSVRRPKRLVDAGLEPPLHPIYRQLAPGARIGEPTSTLYRETDSHARGAAGPHRVSGPAAMGTVGKPRFTPTKAPCYAGSQHHHEPWLGRPRSSMLDEPGSGDEAPQSIPEDRGGVPRHYATLTRRSSMPTHGGTSPAASSSSLCPHSGPQPR